MPNPATHKPHDTGHPSPRLSDVLLPIPVVHESRRRRVLTPLGWLLVSLLALGFLAFLAAQGYLAYDAAQHFETREVSE